MRPSNFIALKSHFFGRLSAWGLGALLALVSQTTLSAADSEPDSESPAQQTELLHPVVDLGKFRIRELHPAQGETTHVTLTLQLALSPQAKESTVEAFQHWHHRLRDQAIIAIRIAETADFAEPGLKRLRRLILLRVNRLFPQALVEDIFLTEFTFSRH